QHCDIVSLTRTDAELSSHWNAYREREMLTVARGALPLKAVSRQRPGQFKELLGSPCLKRRRCSHVNHHYVYVNIFWIRLEEVQLLAIAAPSNHARNVARYAHDFSGRRTVGLGRIERANHEL